MSTRNADDDNVHDRESPEDIVEPLDAEEGHPSPGDPTPMRWAVRAILALTSVALLSFVLAATVFDVFGPLDAPSSPGPPPPPVESCEWLSDLELQQLAERWWATVEAGLRSEPLAETGQAIEIRAEEAFAPVYAHIPEFLDWHYSVAGQYTQLAVVIVTLLQEWGFPGAVVERLAQSELMKAVFDWLQEWEPTRAILERVVSLELPASAREQLDSLQRQVDARLFGDLSDRVRLASDEVERVMRAEMRDLIARRIRNETDLLAVAARVRADAPCSDMETVRISVAYQRMLEAAVPNTVQRFTASAAPTGILSAAVVVRAAPAARALMRGLSGRLSRRLLPRIGRLIGAGVGVWLLLDSLVLYADEYFTREQFQEELTALVDEQKAGLKEDLLARADEVRMTVLGPVTPDALEGQTDGRAARTSLRLPAVALILPATQVGNVGRNRRDLRLQHIDPVTETVDPLSQAVDPASEFRVRLFVASLVVRSQPSPYRS